MSRQRRHADSTRRLRSFLTGGVLVAALAGGLLAGTGGASAATPDVPQPLINRDFPDPSILVTGQGDYAYSTNSRYDGKLINVPVATASSLTGPWSDPGVDALPNLPGWVVYDSSPGSLTYDVWAPDVSRRDDGSYVMYYAALDTNGLHCLGAATSATPAGPFTAVGDQPFLCNTDDVGDIDPMTYQENGHRYLVYKDNANAGGRPDSIWIQEVTPDGLGFVGERHKMLTADATGNENWVAEAPFLVDHNGQYVLFYSADNWNSTYHVKYAVSDTLTGSYTKQGTMLDTGSWNGARPAPGGQDMVHTSDGDYLFFHSTVNIVGQQVNRGLFVTKLDWSDGVPLAGAAPGLAGTYTLSGLNSGQNLTASTYGVVQDPATNNTADRWTLTPQPDGSYRITSASTGQNLAVFGNQVFLMPSFACGRNASWFLDRDFNGYFRIRSATTGAVLTVQDAATAAGAPVGPSANNDGADQKWLPTAS